MKQRLVVCGGSGGEAWLAVRAWLAVGRYDDVAVYCDDPLACAARAEALGVVPILDRGALFDDDTVAAVHLLGGLRGRDETLVALLDRGHRVLASPPLCERGDGAALVAAAGSGRLRDAALIPWLPAFAEGLRRVHANHIGRLEQVRFRSIVAGLGGWDAGLNPDCPLRDEPPPLGLAATLRRELAVTLPLAQAVLGPVVEFSVQAPRREPPYSAIVTWRHRGHARHGVLELTVTPGRTLRSPYAARDDSAEITGTAGILWVGGLRGGPSMVPPLRLYRGATLLEPEPPTGGWPAAWLAMAQHAPAVDPAELRQRAACLVAAEQALFTGDRVVVDP
mgnify:CR=1 FL=1